MIFDRRQMVSPRTLDIPFLSFIGTVLCCFTFTFSVVHAVRLCTEKSMDGLTRDNERRLCHVSCLLLAPAFVSYYTQHSVKRLH